MSHSERIHPSCLIQFLSALVHKDLSKYGILKNSPITSCFIYTSHKKEPFLFSTLCWTHLDYLQRTCKTGNISQKMQGWKGVIVLLHLADINASILFIVRPIAQRQAKFFLGVLSAEFHFLLHTNKTLFHFTQKTQIVKFSEPIKTIY